MRSRMFYFAHKAESSQYENNRLLLYPDFLFQSINLIVQKRLEYIPYSLAFPRHR